MTKHDLTDPEAVEALAALYSRDGLRDDDLVADTLRALSARLVEATAERDRMWSANLNLMRRAEAAERRAEEVEAEARIATALRANLMEADDAS